MSFVSILTDPMELSRAHCYQATGGRTPLRELQHGAIQTPACSLYMNAAPFDVESRQAPLALQSSPRQNTTRHAEKTEELSHVLPSGAHEVKMDDFMHPFDEVISIRFGSGRQSES